MLSIVTLLSRKNLDPSPLLCKQQQTCPPPPRAAPHRPCCTARSNRCDRCDATWIDPSRWALSPPWEPCTKVGSVHNTSWHIMRRHGSVVRWVRGSTNYNGTRNTDGVYDLTILGSLLCSLATYMMMIRPLVAGATGTRRQRRGGGFGIRESRAVWPGRRFGQVPAPTRARRGAPLGPGRGTSIVLQ